MIQIGAAVALKPGVTADPAELRDFVKDRVAAYKYPRKVWIVSEPVWLRNTEPFGA